MERVKKFALENWHFLPVIASVGLIGAGVGMAAGGVPEALMAVGTSNLATVLALSGAALLIPSMLLWHRRSKHSMMDFMNNKYFFAANFLAVAAVAVCGYYATHFHVSTLFAGLSVWESLGAQSLVSFGFGAAIGGLYGLAHSKLIPTLWHRSGFVITCIGIGLICAAATTVGPILTQAMHATVMANSPEAIAMEAMIAVSLASLTLFSISIGSVIWEKLEDWQSKCCSSKQHAKPLFTV
ncbi:MAG: hypothetical protein JSS50_03025 [Proteobacteria bacterium]|nr:hypothetical protein [Pseudomonadota bacterium]